MLGLFTKGKWVVRVEIYKERVTLKNGLVVDLTLRQHSLIYKTGKKNRVSCTAKILWSRGWGGGDV